MASERCEYCGGGVSKLSKDWGAQSRQRPSLTFFSLRPHDWTPHQGPCSLRLKSDTDANGTAVQSSGPFHATGLGFVVITPTGV
jgi:hypothetical protein